MSGKPHNQVEPVEDRNAFLERTLIKEYLREQGYSMKDLRSLPKEEAKRLMTEASRYASLKLEEVEARARFIQELKDDGSPIK